MSLGNHDIGDRVNLIIAELVKETKLTVKDEAVINAAADLLINLLQNINDIAYVCIEDNARSQR